MAIRIIKYPPDKKRALEIFLLLCGLVMVFYFLIVPAANDLYLLAVKQKLALEGMGSDNYQAKLSRNKAIASSSGDLKGKIFSSTKNMPDLISELENLASANKLELKDGINEATDKGDYLVVPLEIKIKGDFGNILAFMSELPDSKFFISLESVDFEKPMASPENDETYDLTMLVNSYWEK